MKLNKLIGLCSEWSNKRNIIKGSTAIDQYLKMHTESGELAENILKKRCVKDDIGDILVCLNNVHLQVTGKDLRHLVESNTKIRLTNSVGENISIKETCIYLTNDISNLGIKLLEKASINNAVAQIKVTLYELCSQLETSLSECLEAAYVDIKDRKGVMYNGAFIKSTDKAYKDILKKIKAPTMAANGNIIK